ncbi:type VII toxin-antitoxin system HepT family RNase toxin [Sulfurisphaera tokodaii]|uniref:DUF86 domain-containing protein n=2 Tax=Sulfurisphaera tokodaii TaxID=111955 RepID=Q973W2_SULTO|nr:DUF86 domain-containing protein [Sulfurisphaera tokodaii]BAB65798.1 hypothetical protein STK_07860 [Sulfurisphaera tokodaii str. 7]HII74607.1 DUF86 domain-containing protein [Sulfurisphaera tokodaii]
MAVLDRLFKNLEDVTAKLDEVVEKGYDLNYWRDQMAILHGLQIQAQIVLDILQRLLSNMGMSAEGYKDSVRKLREKGIINDEEEKFLNAVVGFTNIIVHEYSEVNLGTVDEILRNREYRKLFRLVLEIKQRTRDYWDP